MVARCALLWALDGIRVNAAVPHALADTPTHVDGRAGRITAGQKGGTVHGDKEGGLAVALSMLGIIVVVVFIVGVGSLSVRRRSRHSPPAAREGLLDRSGGLSGERVKTRRSDDPIIGTTAKRTREKVLRCWLKLRCPTMSERSP
jgi:hypothetical protein